MSTADMEAISMVNNQKKGIETQASPGCIHVSLSGSEKAAASHQKTAEKKTSVPVANSDSSKEKPVDAHWEPFDDDYSRTFRCLKRCVKVTYLFALIALICFWGVMSENMTRSMGWPIIGCCIAIGAFQAGKAWMK